MPNDRALEVLRNFVLDRALPHGIERAKTIVVAIRSFIRLLGRTGRCPAGWNMRSLVCLMAARIRSPVPRNRYVERVIDSCTGHEFELRDRAVLLLLALMQRHQRNSLLQYRYVATIEVGSTKSSPRWATRCPTATGVKR
jgi:hypothetical protein